MASEQRLVLLVCVIYGVVEATDADRQCFGFNGASDDTHDCQVPRSGILTEYPPLIVDSVYLVAEAFTGSCLVLVTEQAAFRLTTGSVELIYRDIYLDTFKSVADVKVFGGESADEPVGELYVGTLDACTARLYWRVPSLTAPLLFNYTLHYTFHNAVKGSQRKSDVAQVYHDFLGGWFVDVYKAEFTLTLHSHNATATAATVTSFPANTATVKRVSATRVDVVYQPVSPVPTEGLLYKIQFHNGTTCGEQKAEFNECKEPWVTLYSFNLCYIAAFSLAIAVTGLWIIGSSLARTHRESVGEWMARISPASAEVWWTTTQQLSARDRANRYIRQLRAKRARG